MPWRRPLRGAPVTAARGPKRSKEEIRSLLLHTGRQLLRDQGLGTGAGALTFKRVFDRVEADTGIRLTHASVIRRVWQSQADYQADVLVALVADESAFEIDRTLEAVTPLVEAVDRSTPEARWRALAEFVRVGGAANQQALHRSDQWSTWLGVWAVTARPGAPEQARVAAALVERYRYITDRYEAVYSAMAALLGFRLRQPLTIRQFTVVAGALTEGYAVRGRIDPSVHDPVVPYTASSPGEEWTLYALALHALARRFLEIDPDWRPT